MSQTIGIYIEHNVKGIPVFARIDLKKYGAELKDFFDSKGISVETSPYNPQFVAKIKSQENMPGVKIKASEIWK
ncbi:MAG: hypothetical protein LBI65_04660 [Candidatus Symbiothrix sp.]|jgi:hypothetical protein|nr:hypothetical protein [Candidatus Symbiothrix sp.]